MLCAFQVENAGDTTVVNLDSLEGIVSGSATKIKSKDLDELVKVRSAASHFYSFVPQSDGACRCALKHIPGRVRHGYTSDRIAQTSSI